MSRIARPSVLDRPIARVFALFCCAASLGALAYIHRDDLFPSSQVERAASDPYMKCFSERAAQIDKMREEGLIAAEQHALFRSRAEALCRDQTSGGSGPPPLQGRSHDPPPPPSPQPPPTSSSWVFSGS